MEKEKNISPGFDESDERSALSLVEGDNHTWYLSHEDNDWSFCPAVSKYAGALTNRKLATQFRRHLSESGAAEFECLAMWKSGSIEIRLPSGRCASTRESLERLIPLINNIPPKDQLDWAEVLRERVPFPGISAPAFVNTTKVGPPTIICKLTWGNTFDRREAESPPLPTRNAAFENAIDQAIAIGPAFNPPPRVEPPKKTTSTTNWINAVRFQTGKQLASSKVMVNFEVSEKGVSCKIQWGVTQFQAVNTFPLSNEQSAFDQALQYLKNALAKQTSTPSPSDSKKSQPKKIPPNLETQGAAFLLNAKALWATERAWLMNAPQQSREQQVRLHDLNTFLVLLDPLRRLEIDSGARGVAIGRIKSELMRIHAGKGKFAKSNVHAEQLRALLGRRFAEAGTIVAKTPEFVTHVSATGADSIKVIDGLVEAGLLRKSANGNISVSALGANLLEQNLGADIKRGTFGEALPAGVLELILNLKNSLSSE